MGVGGQAASPNPTVAVDIRAKLGRFGVPLGQNG